MAEQFENPGKGSGKRKTPYVDEYGEDLTAEAAKGNLDPIIGREKEVYRICQILSRRKKNNPIILGDPGVGKTALVEAIAQRIVDKKVARTLLKKRVISINISNIVAGTKYRGEFEERMKNIVDELKNNKDIIVFIDELHTIVGAGGVSGSLDASNILKPALARGQVQCIGATTLDEYRENIEDDGALTRRFQEVFIDPPSEEDTIEILQKIKGNYEDYHAVEYTDDAIEACVTLSTRYITSRELPDKAIDLIDEAASRIRMEIDSKPESMDRLERRLIQLKIEREAVNKDQTEAAQKQVALLDVQVAELDQELSDLDEILTAEKAAVQGAAKIKAAIEHAKLDLEMAQRAGDLTRMSEIQYGELPELDKQLGIAEQVEQGPTQLLRNRVTEEEVAEVVSRWTGIPISKMLEGDREKLLRMESVLHERVVGQDEAVIAVANAVRRSRAGLSDPNRPNGSFLFLGPTGVGKTELCKALASFVFDSDQAMVRLDMSEFMEKHSVARLIGAPPGYVGYEAGGYLTEAVRRRPYSLLLLDEVEKAHPDVFNMLLQVLDDGYLTDSLGRKIDFRNTIIIMTSNIGARKLKDFGTGIGFGTASQKAQEDDNARSVIENALKKSFAPEFLNRIDDVVIFNALEKEDINKIIDIELEKLLTRIKGLGYILTLTESAKNYIAEKGFDKQYGARPLKRAIQKYVEDALAEEIVASHLQEGDHIKIDLDTKTDELSISIEKAEKPTES